MKLECNKILPLLEKRKQYREKDIISIVKNNYPECIVNHMTISSKLYYFYLTNRLERIEIQVGNKKRYEYKVIE